MNDLTTAPEAPTLSDIITDLLAYQAEQFDETPQFMAVPGLHSEGDAEAPHHRGPFDTREEAQAECDAFVARGLFDYANVKQVERGDLDVSGADLVDAFTQWRIQLKAALATRPAAFAPAPIGLLEIAADLSAAIEGLDHQIEQMKGMFPDDDGAIRQAQDDGDEARQRLAMFRKGAPPITLYVSRSENNLDIWSAAPIPGFEVVTLTYDIDDLANYETDDVTMVRFGNGAYEPCLVGKYEVTGSGRTPRMRPATDKDMDS